MLYGPHGVGKSTWAAGAPKPLFIDCEDGLNDLDCDKTPLCRSLGDVQNVLSYVLNNETSYRTLVLDTVDWLEKAIFRHLSQTYTRGQLEYGRDSRFAEEVWNGIVHTLDMIREQRRMAVVLLAHCQRVKVTPPGGDSYDRWEPALDKRATDTLTEWCDEVLFAEFRVATTTEEAGFNRQRKIAVDLKERQIRTADSVNAICKHRLALPETIGMEFADYAKYLPRNVASQKATGNVEGIVVNGSSKPPVDPELEAAAAEVF
jgi:hypothetical protein